jgi:hypothetical protein
MKYRLTIIAGDGEIPIFAVQAALKKGYDVQIISLTNANQDAIKNTIDNYQFIEPGKIGKILKSIREFDSKSVLFAGSINRGILYRGLKPDLKALKALTMLRGFDNKSVMDVIEKLISETGAKLISQKEFLKEHIAKKGVIAGRRPSKKMMSQIEKFIPIVKTFENMGSGQVFVIKDNHIVAIEAMEGSDETISRAGRLAGNGIIVIKAVSDDHNFKFDLPTVGTQTLEAINKAGGGYLVVEAHKILILNIDKFINLANTYKISVYSY